MSEPSREAGAPPPAARRAPRAGWPPAALLLLLTCAAFWPVLGNGYATIDDPRTIVGNPFVQGGLSGQTVAWALVPRHANWMPLTWVSLALDVSLFGPGPFGHHLAALLLHALAAVLAFAALRALTGDRRRALLVAALFAVHPLQVESVAWATERSNLLAGVAWFATLLLYARHARRPGRGSLLAVAAAVALGLATKPLVVTLPCVLLLLDVWPLGRLAARGPGALLREKAPLFALAAAAGLVAVVSQRAAGALPGIDAYSAGARVSNAAVSTGRYLVKAAWPARLSLYYPPAGTGLHPAKVAAGAALLLAVSLAAWHWRRRRPALAIGWAWYLIVLAPVVGIVQAGSQSFADRFAYLSLAGIWVGLAWGVPAPRRRPAAAAALGALVALLAVASHRQALLWRTPTSLAEHVLAREPGNLLAAAEIAITRTQRGDHDGALDALVPLVREYPGSASLRDKLADALAARGDLEAALHHRRLAAALPSPVTERYRAEAAELARVVEDLERTVAQARRRLESAPEDVAALVLLGGAELRLGRYAAAVPPLERAAEHAPARADIAYFLGTARAGHPHPGEEALRRAEAPP